MQGGCRWELAASKSQVDRICYSWCSDVEVDNGLETIKLKL